MQKLKQPIRIMVIGLIVMVIACLLTGIMLHPAITEHDFHYSVTYKLNGETKTFEGVYTCRFSSGDYNRDPLERYYDGEYSDYGLVMHSQTYTIEQKGEFDLGIVTTFNDSYLMGDTLDVEYDYGLEDPYLVIYGANEVVFDDEETRSLFDAEIISWEYPEPLENSYVFAGFSQLYEISMLVMLLVAIIVFIICLVVVKRDAEVTYNAVDVVSIVLNYLIAIVVFPFITFFAWLVQAFETGPEWIYQGYFVIPAIIVYSLAASVSLRRKGFKKSGLFVQLAGIVVFAVLLLLEGIA
jgi:hypothetical protein